MNRTAAPQMKPQMKPQQMPPRLQCSAPQPHRPRQAPLTAPPAAPSAAHQGPRPQWIPQLNARLLPQLTPELTSELTPHLSPELTSQLSPQLTLYYDHTCAVCRGEMARLKRWDRHARLALIDVSAPGFRAEAHGFSAAALDRELHGVCADGRVLRGLECIRLAYALTRYGWLWRVTALPGLKPLFDRFYLWFARNRQSISRYAHPGYRRRQEAASSQPRAGPAAQSARRATHAPAPARARQRGRDCDGACATKLTGARS